VRYNPPPGWPPPPRGWTPPPDWEPDPSWPAPPPGWRLWVPPAWFERTRVVVGALVLFFPLGLVLVWLRADWSRARRGWITAGVAAAVLIGTAACASPEPPRERPVAVDITAPPATLAPRSPLPPSPTPRRTRRPSPKPSPTAKPRKPPAPKPQPLRCGAPPNPYGLNLCGQGGLVNRPPRNVCDYFDCTDYFWYGHGYMVRCNDGRYSHSGGRHGACSRHHGEGEAVRQR
jgi:hypothetical protein